MSHETNHLLILPLENLPEPIRPTPKSYTIHFLEINAETQQLLDECDWNIYENSVLEGMQEAVKRYIKTSLLEKIYQVSIGTDPQSQITTISFETKTHAQAQIQQSAEWFREHGLKEVAEQTEGTEYNPNPADFLNSNYYTILHRELRSLNKVDYSSKENENAAEAWIEPSLFKIVERVQALNLFAELPREEEIWIGISSPHYWYDHVIKVKV